MEDYRLAYYFLSSKVSEIAEILRKPLEGETREQIKNSAAARTVQAMDLLEDARLRSQEMLHASEPQGARTPGTGVVFRRGSPASHPVCVVGSVRNLN